MRPPLAGKREAALRLAGEVRRRLEPVERVLPVRLPGFGGRGRPAVRAAPEPVPADPPALAPEAEDAAARIDAARERLRATIPPPDDERQDG